MWNDKNFQARGFSTPPPTWNSKRPSPVMPASEKKLTSSPAKADLFHVIHKVPAGDSPYVRAKHIQLIEKDPGRAISLFWKAINSGDRVDSALKDMAVVMKQLDRSDEAIEAIKSFRHLCPHESQESLDNVLVELYKRSGRIEEQIEMLQLKLKHIEEGIAFGGKRTKAARSQGKKIHITIEQEYSRLLGNLAWAHLQQNNFKCAEELYRKALSLESDKNKQCNLAICLIYMNKITEAKFLLQAIRASSRDEPMDESYAKSFERAVQILAEVETSSVLEPISWEEKGTGKENRTPPVNGNGNYISSCNAEKIVLFDERNGGADKGNVRNSPFGPRSGSKTSPGTSYVDKVNKKGCYTEYNYETSGAFGFNQKKTCASPFPPRGTPKVPLTQPRRCGSWSFNNRDHGRVSEEIHNSRCNRKLSFENGQNFDLQIPASTNEMSKVRSLNPRNWTASSSQDWRKNPSGGDRAEVNDKSVIMPVLSVDSKKNFCGQDNNCAIESSAAVDNVRECPKELSMPRSKKSWADLVEEDELELSYFNDENINSNIVIQLTPTPLDPTENLSRKIESLNSKDGYYTQPQTDSTVNRTARRSLYFDQQEQKQENFCSSPLPNKALNFGIYDCSSFGGNEKEGISGNGVKLLRRNRLQVFRDITLLPESPRP